MPASQAGKVAVCSVRAAVASLLALPELQAPLAEPPSSEANNHPPRHRARAHWEEEGSSAPSPLPLNPLAEAFSVVRVPAASQLEAASLVNRIPRHSRSRRRVFSEVNRQTQLGSSVAQLQVEVACSASKALNSRRQPLEGSLARLQLPLGAQALPVSSVEAPNNNRQVADSLEGVLSQEPARPPWGSLLVSQVVGCLGRTLELPLVVSLAAMPASPSQPDLAC